MSCESKSVTETKWRVRDHRGYVLPHNNSKCTFWTFLCRLMHHFLHFLHLPDRSHPRKSFSIDFQLKNVLKFDYLNSRLNCRHTTIVWFQHTIGRTIVDVFSTNLQHRQMERAPCDTPPYCNVSVNVLCGSDIARNVTYHADVSWMWWKREKKSNWKHKSDLELERSTHEKQPNGFVIVRFFIKLTSTIFPSVNA